MTSAPATPVNAAAQPGSGTPSGQPQPKAQLLARAMQSRLAGVYLFGVIFLAASFVLRTALLVRAFYIVDHSATAVLRIYATGLFYDAVTFFYFMAPVILYVFLAPERLFNWKISRWARLLLFGTVVFVLLFDVAAEWFFWDEFECRFNFVAVNYLIYTQEVVQNIWESYPVATIIAGIFVIAAGAAFLSRKVFLRPAATPAMRTRLLGIVVCLAVPAASFFLVDSTTLGVPANSFNAELAKNGLYSIVYAFGENTIDYEQFYRTTDNRQAFAHLRELLAEPNSRFVSQDPMDITRQVTNPGPEKRCNVVMIVVESLSGEFLGALGNEKGLTPNLDELSKHSLFFTSFYAAGTRTDRGLESLMLSIPPTPGRSALKRPSNAGMFTIGQLFAQRGYRTEFIYGGSNRFDDMGTFFKGNGFACIEQSDFVPSEVTFSNAWGVCDEDLLGRTLKEGDACRQAGKPFFFVIMTTSNHRPFTFPPGKVAVGGRKGGVRYADLAIGEFLRQAKAKPWFDNTLFVIVADHCASSAGKAQVTVSKYRIPLLVYAPKIITPQVIRQFAPQQAKLAGQIDVAPTLLGLLNFSYRSRFYGRDILKDGRGIALSGNYDTLGLFEGNKLCVLGLQPPRSSHTFDVLPSAEQRETAEDSQLLLDTITYYQTSSFLLKHGLYTSN